MTRDSLVEKPIMKVLGLLGGMTFEATTVYHGVINRHVRNQLGPRRSALLFLYSADLETMLELAAAGRSDAFADVYVRAAHAMVQGGAQTMVLTAIIAHGAAEHIERQIAPVPLLHIADFVGAEIKTRGFQRVALLGMKVAMEGAFFKGRIEAKFSGTQVLIPRPEEREEVHERIVTEVTTGKVSAETKYCKMN